MTEFIDEPLDDFELEEEEKNGPGLMRVLILIFLIAAMLTTLVWPLLRQSMRRHMGPPTPTPIFLQEA